MSSPSTTSSSSSATTPAKPQAAAGSDAGAKIIKAILLGCESIAAAILVGSGKLDPSDPNFQQQANQAINILQTQEQRVLYGFDAKAEALSGNDPDTSFGDPQVQLIAQALTGGAPVPTITQLTGIQPMALLQLLANLPPSALSGLPASTQSALTALIALIPKQGAATGTAPSTPIASPTVAGTVPSP
jgi:hypothetical protein